MLWSGPTQSKNKICRQAGLCSGGGWLARAPFRPYAVGHVPPVYWYPIEKVGGEAPLLFEVCGAVAEGV